MNPIHGDLGMILIQHVVMCITEVVPSGYMLIKLCHSWYLRKDVIALLSLDILIAVNIICPLLDILIAVNIICPLLDILIVVNTLMPFIGHYRHWYPYYG